MSNQKVSPLKEKPLRQAGQGAREQMLDYAIDNLVLIPVIVSMGWIVMIIEWARYFYPQPAHPFLYSLIALLLLAWGIFRGRKSLKNLDRMKQGKEGEMVVGQMLDEFVAKGFHVRHDIPVLSKKGKRFNLDHVLVSSKGIFVVETKTWSKHENGIDKIDADERGLRVAGYHPEKDILAQALGESDWLSGMLSEKTGRNVTAKPVLTFPGWWIDPSAQKYASKKGVLLVNPKALGQFIENEVEVLSRDDVELYVSLLSSYIREFVED